MNVTAVPLQTAVAEDTALTVGVGFTLTETVCVEVQPVLSPVTVYVSLADGETVTTDVVALLALLLQVYVAAPDAVKVTEAPLQIVVVDAAMATVGVVFTLTVIVFVDVQPPPLSPVTVYVSVEPGVTVTVAVVALPALALHVYVVAPDAVNVTDPPPQITVLEAAIETVGVGVTFTTTVCVAIQPPLSPVTVNVAFETGDAVAVAVVALPAFALQV